MKTLTHESLVSSVSYDPATGGFTRLVDSAKGKTKAGDSAGHLEKSGYFAIWVRGKKYLAHRLAWLYMTGRWPESQIDHINGCRYDNRFLNLREANNAENQQNIIRAKAHNKCGLLGVSRNKKRWKAEIRANGYRKHIGTYDSPEEAHRAYLTEKTKMHIGGARG